eukprot:gene11837-24817_t
MSARGKADRPWFKPPPLDSIDISDEELEKNLFLRFCSLLNTITGAVGGLSSLIHAFMIFRGPWSVWDTPIILTRFYFVGFGIMIVCQEREWIAFFRQFTFLESWIGRGLFLILCSSIMLSVSHPKNDVLQHLRIGIAFVMGLVGLLYFSMGLLCFRHLKIRQLTQIRKKKQVHLQAQQLSQHKSEIEKLLRETESKMEIL